jgi:hypothetical protein
MSNFENENENEYDGLFGGFGKDDFVLTQSNNGDGTTQFVGGGYKVNSFFLQRGNPIMTTYNNNSSSTHSSFTNSSFTNSSDQSGGKVSSPFENLAVPAGLFYINQRIPKNYLDEDIDTDTKHHYYKQHETVSDDMIDKLFGLVDADKKRKRKTKKHIENSNKKKTRKA